VRAATCFPTPVSIVCASGLPIFPPIAQDKPGQQAESRDQERLFPNETHRAEANAGLVEFLSDLRNIFSQVMLGELKFDFTLMRLFGCAHDQAVVIVRLFTSGTEGAGRLG